MFTSQGLLEKYGAKLALRLLKGKRYVSRPIHREVAQRPGVALAGFLEEYCSAHILIMGRVEGEYLQTVPTERQEELLHAVIQKDTPTVIVADDAPVSQPLLRVCTRKHVPLLATPLSPTELTQKLHVCLHEELTKEIVLHGTFLEIFGVGVVIKGQSAVGKSEAALGLIARGHRLISDDVVKVRARGWDAVEGYGPDLTKYWLEIRGIGLINVAHAEGCIFVRPKKQIDLMISLEEWNLRHFYDRVGLDKKFCMMHGRMVPYYLLPIKPGRNLVLLVETAVRLYCMYHNGVVHNRASVQPRPHRVDPLMLAGTYVNEIHSIYTY